jgi:hypothetical protein
MDIVFDHPYLRSEFDWLALDQMSNVGYFSTAGVGPLPKPVLARADSFELLLESVLALPECSEATIVYESQHNISEWIAIARRGLFAFDWRRNTSCYELIAKPTDICRCQASANAMFFSVAVTLPQADFSISNALCVAGDRLIARERLKG